MYKKMWLYNVPNTTVAHQPHTVGERFRLFDDRFYRSIGKRLVGKIVHRVATDCGLLLLIYPEVNDPTHSGAYDFKNWTWPVVPVWVGEQSGILLPRDPRASKAIDEYNNEVSRSLAL